MRVLLTTLLLAGGTGKAVSQKLDEFADTDSAVMICCPVPNGMACDWLTEAEDGHEKMMLARLSKSTGITTAVCPLLPSA
ncbi:hypothetical protein [Citrobacter amalonaticus]|uniref:hypothetical protein n=1 Tax=Citrobacter amalonaticus TaxID=35703 RepID=UPI00300CBC18